MLNKITRLYRESFSGLSRDIWLLTLITLINRSGTMVVPFIAIYLTQQLDFSLGQTGVVMSFFGVGSVVGSYLGGWLTDKFGYYRTMFWSLFIGGIALLNLLWLEAFEAWCGGVFLVTAIGDCFRPASMAAVGFYSKPENRTRSLGLIRLAVNLGFGIGPMLGGIIAAICGYSWIFIIDGVTCMAAALSFLLILKESHRPPKAGETPKDLLDTSPLSAPPRSPYRDKIFLAYVSFALINCIVFIQFMGTLPLYWKKFFLFTDTEIGLLLGMNGLIIVLIEMPLITLLEKRYSILGMIALGTLLTGLCYEMLTWTAWAGIAVISMLALTVGEIINFPFAASFSLNRAHETNRGKYMGMYGLSFSLGHIIAPVLGMYLAERFGFSTLWHVMGAMSLISAAGIMWVRQQAKEEEKELRSLEVEELEMERLGG